MLIVTLSRAPLLISLRDITSSPLLSRSQVTEPTVLKLSQRP